MIHGRSRSAVAALRLAATVAAVCVGALALLIGCGRDRVDSDVAVVRDSAGVSVVTNDGAGLWATGHARPWTVVDSPVVRIGVVEGDPAYELRLARGAVRLPDGRLIVANAGSSELRVYDDGRHLGSVGRDGEGPGEFRNIRGVWRYRGDSLAVWDASLRRVSVFSTVPAFGRSFPLEAPGDALAPSLAGVFPDGSILVLGAARITPALGAGVHRRPGLVLRYGSSGSVEDTIAVAMGEEWVGVEGANGVALMARPFGRDSHIAVVDTNVAVADGARFEILIFTRRGNLVRRVLRSGDNRRVTPDELADFEQSQVERARTREAAIRTRERLQRVPMHDSYPAMVDMLVDDDANLWLEESRAVGEIERSYTVMDRSGQLLGRVAMPDNLEPLEIGADYVLGRAVDEMGVEYIQMHRLEKPR